MNRFHPFRIVLSLLLAFLMAGGSCFAEWIPNAQEEELAVLMKNDPGQMRPELVFDPILAEVARSRAADMAARNFFSHVNPDGFAANYLIRNAGYSLPDWWGTNPQDNFVESIAAGHQTAQDVWNDWLGSIHHRTHLLALDEGGFFATETHYGIGYVSVPGSKYGTYWVVITAPPAGISIESPRNNENLTSDQVMVNGGTDPSLPIASVTARLENSNGTSPAVVATGTTAWQVALQALTSGTNLIRVQGKDADGTVLCEAAVRVTLLSPLTVSVSGSGSVTAAFTGTTYRQANTAYLIEAIPAKGYLFAGWTGGIQSPAPKLNFLMKEDLTLQANFVENPFPAAKGNYLGVNISGLEGKLSLSLGSSGAFTGKVYLGTTAYNFKGRFDSLGQSDLVIERPGKFPITIHLTLDTNGEQEITVTLSDGGTTSSFVANLAAFGKANPAPLAGDYTFVFAPQNSNPAAPVYPKGNSIGTLQINPAGMATLVGRLADNTRFTYSAPVSKDGTLPIYAFMPKSQGLLSGILEFKDLAKSDASGLIRWTKVPGKDPLYPLGYTILLDGTVSSYVRPSTTTLTTLSAPVQGASTLSLTDLMGNVLVSIPATISPTGTVELTSSPVPAQLTLSTNLKNGTISGSFIDPATNLKRSISAVVLQKQGTAFGFFSGKPGNGVFSVQP